MNLKPNEKLDIDNILEDLEHYSPRRMGWHWRDGRGEVREIGPFCYSDTSENLTQSQPLPAAHYFNNIDPQPDSVITTEIASGRFEDDIRRMRMAAWNGADHLMVIRTAGQSHFDGLIEGTPQGIGGIPITRKQLRAQRKALDYIEDEVGREINYHSYVSGVAGPEIAVMFAEEGVNGAHQDPQYNVLYRNINMIRSFVDAANAKHVMAYAGIVQIDGAHNANATAREAWRVMPELMVQHGLNSMFSVKSGIKKENICLSSVPPTAPPAPCMRLDLPYAIALRELFREYKIRAQQNTKYMGSSTREATVTHTLNLLISKLTSADIQSTITPDEGRNVPWHIYNIEGTNTAKQAMIGMDGLKDMVALKRDEGFLPEKIRELKERAVLFMEEILDIGGYFNAVEAGFFVDSGCYPERNYDGIVRKINGGVGAGTVFTRDEDYMAPVTAFFGYNNTSQYGEEAVKDPSSLISGCTFEDRSKIMYIDELDEEDNVYKRLEETKDIRKTSILKPEMEWMGDGTVLITMMLPTDERTAEFAAVEIGKKMNLEEVEVIHKQVMQIAEGTRIEIKGKVSFGVDINDLVIPPKPIVMSDDEIREDIKNKPMKIVAGTIGEDEHSVGLREILDIKHGGIEKYGIECHYLGTSVPVAKIVDSAIELNADAILASTIISHDEIHYKNMKRINDYCVEKGIRDKIILVSGGTQVTPEIAVKNGMDAGFGRGSKGVDVATFLVKKRRENEKDK
ncbi:D-ornithine 4,5-aminomutase subunit OraE [Vallitalea sp.]|jgi:D-ornithine 4,5-aminomutase subunit beta|uniref:D-ornithine 4,5-aminomutase subunit OraE n=1 Tax=Vallitalea sp. TaxID=1882829 RepID=UPI0025E36AF8|nr:D-ornithine 4,5-aminomutase subunit OraE [Vallitalea sp.]MCT4687240.1 D-ornithine 4,5-aminomutase subunit OraE [Vallitalea sp.]